MNDFGVEMLRHNNWANLALIDFCESLPEEVLDASAPGTYGRIRETLVHMVAAQERYTQTLRELQPSEAKVNERRGWPGFSMLRETATASGQLLEELAEGGESGWTLQGESDGGRRWSIAASVLLTQSVHHATDHRSQINTMLTNAGVEPPNLDVWVWGEATGREREEPQ